MSERPQVEVDLNIFSLDDDESASRSARARGLLRRMGEFFGNLGEGKERSRNENEQGTTGDLVDVNVAYKESEIAADWARATLSEVRDIHPKPPQHDKRIKSALDELTTLQTLTTTAQNKASLGGANALSTTEQRHILKQLLRAEKTVNALFDAMRNDVTLTAQQAPETSPVAEVAEEERRQEALLLEKAHVWDAREHAWTSLSSEQARKIEGIVTGAGLALLAGSQGLDPQLRYQIGVGATVIVGGLAVAEQFSRSRGWGRLGEWLQRAHAASTTAFIQGGILGWTGASAYGVVQESGAGALTNLIPDGNVDAAANSPLSGADDNSPISTPTTTSTPTSIPIQTIPAGEAPGMATVGEVSPLATPAPDHAQQQMTNMAGNTEPVHQSMDGAESRLTDIANKTVSAQSSALGDPPLDESATFYNPQVDIDPTRLMDGAERTMRDIADGQSKNIQAPPSLSADHYAEQHAGFRQQMPSGQDHAERAMRGLSDAVTDRQMDGAERAMRDHSIQDPNAVTPQDVDLQPDRHGSKSLWERLRSWTNPVDEVQGLRDDALESARAQSMAASSQAAGEEGKIGDLESVRNGNWAAASQPLAVDSDGVLTNATTSSAPAPAESIAPRPDEVGDGYTVEDGRIYDDGVWPKTPRPADAPASSLAPGERPQQPEDLTRFVVDTANNASNWLEHNSPFQPEQRRALAEVVSNYAQLVADHNGVTISPDTLSLAQQGPAAVEQLLTNPDVLKETCVVLAGACEQINTGELTLTSEQAKALLPAVETVQSLAIDPQIPEPVMRDIERFVLENTGQTPQQIGKIFADVMTRLRPLAEMIDSTTGQ